jgi:hypothetical protein
LQLAVRCPDSFFGECETLALFVSSVIDLGEPVGRAAGSFLASRFLSYPGAQEDRAFLAFAILLLGVYTGRGGDRGAWLKQLATGVKDEESTARQLEGGCSVGEEWLLGLTVFNGHEELWRYLARRILAEPTSPHPTEADQSLRELGELIVKRQ